MRALRELILLISTLTWVGAGLYMAMSVIGQDLARTEEAREMASMGVSPYVFAVGVILFVAVSLLWKKKKRT